MGGVAFACLLKPQTEGTHIFRVQGRELSSNQNRRFVSDNPLAINGRGYPPSSILYSPCEYRSVLIVTHLAPWVKTNGTIWGR